ncbi:MAG TPA: nucleotide disphospho-sugar-binding domain-containing protein [Jiangellales bacterium]|nr:nucleotide disphospho-sugar-binding domain-containing protein [Jiangellales bacterium]
MTRVLFTSLPMAGHVRPGLPVVTELAAAGHEVFFYTGRKYGPETEAAGARFVPYDPTLDWDDAALSGDDESGTRQGLAALRRDLVEIFVRPIPAYVRDLERVVDQVDPDVVVTEHSFAAGVTVAELRGLPRVAYSITPLILSSRDTAPFGTALPPASGALGRLRNRTLNALMRHVVFAQAQRAARQGREELGLPPLPGYFMDWQARQTDRYLAATVPELEYERSDLPASVEFVGALLPRRALAATEPPEWWPDLLAARTAGRPVVHVTQGTIATTPTNLLLPTIEALADEDVLVVATTGGPDPDAVLPTEHRPANLRLERFVPHASLLPQVDVMVTNGGFGGVQVALAHGVPLVGAGTTEDKGEVNARVERAGAGISLRTDTPSPERIRAAVLRILSDRRYQDAARSLGAAYARYDGAARVAEIVLEEARRRTTGGDRRPTVQQGRLTG